MSRVGQDKSVDAGPSRGGRRLLPNDRRDCTCHARLARGAGWACACFPWFL